MEFVIVSGLSGAGKSCAVDVLEDIGFYCVDNMPPALMPKFAELCMQSKEVRPRVAVVIDARGGESLRGFSDHLEELKKANMDYRILFLDCENNVLARRYKETRRKHPLTDSCNGSVTKAIEAERELLGVVRSRTDYLIDTTHLSSSQLRERLVSMFLENTHHRMSVQCMSFGFKYGYPAEADMLFDVRCFPNPFYVDNLRNKTGLDQEVRDFVLESEDAMIFLHKLCDMVDFLIPKYEKEGKSQLVIAVGCTGGKHRSVTFTEALARHLQGQEHRLLVNHRDIQKL